MCATEVIIKDGPPEWLFVPQSLGRGAVHVCLQCQDKPIADLARVMREADGEFDDNPPVRRMVRP
jgi:hypothetical protein